MFASTYNEAYHRPSQRTTWGIKKWLKDRDLNLEEYPDRDLPIYRNSETLTQLAKECLTPFNYLIEPKPIVQTNPLQEFQTLELPKDDASARLTRPRVFRAPEISLDDIEDLNVRDKIIDYTYATTWGLASKDAAMKTTKAQVPRSTWEPPYHVLFNKREGFDEEECEIGSEGELSKWDKEQSRAVGDPTTACWQQLRNRPLVKVMDQQAIDIKSPTYTRNILNLEKEGRLRFPYQLKPVNYAGFVPACPIGIESRKDVLESTDPMITVYQLSNRWCEK